MKQRTWFSGPPAHSGNSGIPLPNLDSPSGDVPVPPPAPPPVVVSRAAPVLPPCQGPPPAPAKEPQPPREPQPAGRLAAFGQALHADLVLVRQLARRAVPYVATRQMGLAAGSLAALLFIGCYTGQQVHQFLQSPGQRSSSVVAQAEKHVQTKLVSSTALREISPSSETEVSAAPPSPEATALFAAVSQGLTRPVVAQVASRPAGAWQRLEEALPLPEPPAFELPPQFASISLEMPAAAVEGVCSDETCELCIAPDPDELWNTKLGTALEWHSDYEEARRLAATQGKMLFVICISGDFSNPEFT